MLLLLRHTCEFFVVINLSIIFAGRLTTLRGAYSLIALGSSIASGLTALLRKLKESWRRAIIWGNLGPWLGTGWPLSPQWDITVLEAVRSIAFIDVAPSTFWIVIRVPATVCFAICSRGSL